MFVSCFLLMPDMIFLLQLICSPFGNFYCSLYSKTTSKIDYSYLFLWSSFCVISYNLCYPPSWCFWYFFFSTWIDDVARMFTVTADRFVGDVILITAGRVVGRNVSLYQRTVLWWQSIAPRLLDINPTFNSTDFNVILRDDMVIILYIEDHSRTIIFLIKFIIHHTTCTCWCWCWCWCLCCFALGCVVLCYSFFHAVKEIVRRRPWCNGMIR